MTQQPPDESKGSTRRTWLGQVGKGLGLTALGGLIYAKGCWDGKDYKGEPGQEEIDRLYATVYDHILARHREAEEARRPLVILVGDSHADEGRNPLIVQLVAIDAAHDLGIRTLAPELDRERLARLQRDEEKGQLVDVPNFKPAMQYARAKGFSVLPIDTYEENAKARGETPPPRTECVPERNAEMVSHLLATPRGAVAIVGDAHLRGLVESELSEKRTVATITGHVMDRHARLIVTSGLGDLMTGRNIKPDIDFIYDSPKVLRVPLETRMPDSRIGRSADMVQKARDHYLEGRGTEVPAR